MSRLIFTPAALQDLERLRDFLRPMIQLTRRALREGLECAELKHPGHTDA